MPCFGTRGEAGASFKRKGRSFTGRCPIGERSAAAARSSKNPAGKLQEVDKQGIPRAANCWAVRAEGAGRATRHASAFTKGACAPEDPWS